MKAEQNYTYGQDPHALVDELVRQANLRHEIAAHNAAVERRKREKLEQRWLKRLLWGHHG